MIGPINHLTLSVRDLQRAFSFYVDLLGCRPLARWDSGAYLLAGGSWLCLSLDEATREGPLPEYSHVAFDIDPGELDALAGRRQTAGVRRWRNNHSEGASLYILDPDGHKLELHHGDWRSRLQACRNSPYPGMVFFADAAD
jgi:glutathione S-transferase fosA5